MVLLLYSGVYEWVRIWNGRVMWPRVNETRMTRVRNIETGTGDRKRVGNDEEWLIPLNAWLPVTKVCGAEKWSAAVPLQPAETSHCVQVVSKHFGWGWEINGILIGHGHLAAMEMGAWLCVRFLHFTNFLTIHQKNLNQICIISGVLSDRYECYSKEYSCLANYGYMHACDDYYTKCT